jgi:signal transduction histidine kinase
MDLSALAATLDVLVLERRDDGRFVASAPAPSWCAALCGDLRTDDGGFDVTERFEFLSAFLADAEQAWAGPSGTRTTSDFWTETTSEGIEIHLEATAVRIGDARALVVRRNERFYAQQKLVLQRARERFLAHEALTREIEAKDILVHAVVHDLAAPLHSILGTLSLLAEGVPAEQAGPLVQLALAAAMRQRDMITEILDVFSSEHGGLAGVDASPPDAAAVLAQVVDERMPVASRRGVHVRLRGADAPAEVVADAHRLFRVATNLLDNAIRHSPRGGTVDVSLEPDGDAWVLTVADEGPGVAAELVPQLFEKLPRGRDRRGTGLGLYFCRITIEAWGGRVGYEPRSPHGSRFWARLPSAAPSRSRAATTQRIDHGQAPAGG